jgi:hypothetical protein
VLTGREHHVHGVDTGDLACGGREDPTLPRSLKGLVKELYLAGDCASMRRLTDTMMDGARLLRTIWQLGELMEVGSY